MRFLRSLQSSIAILAMSSIVACATAQEPESAAKSEAAAQQLLLHATKVAVADRGVDNRWPAEDVNYVQLFTEALQTWGRYQIVPAADADVVLELSGATTIQSGYTTDSDNNSIPWTNVAPYLRIAIRPADAVNPLWTVTVPVYSGTWKNRDLLAMSADTAVSQLKLLDGVQLTKQEKSDLVWAKTRFHHAVGWMVGGFLVLAAAGGIGMAIAVKHGEDQQHNFCVQNKIPGC